jgi:hypothetical protein
MKQSVRDVAIKAAEVYAAWDDGAERDAAFDGGEFSGPACSRHADAEVEALAAANGFTFDEVQTELLRLSNEPSCDALGYHNFPRGAADPHCTRCGLAFSTFKTSAKAVAE